MQDNLRIIKRLSGIFYYADGGVCTRILTNDNIERILMYFPETIGINSYLTANDHPYYTTPNSNYNFSNSLKEKCDNPQYIKALNDYINSKPLVNNNKNLKYWYQNKI